jgi:glycosyltransferase involved in cell wall biosynthesis
VPMRDAAALQVAVSALLKDKNLRESLGAAGRRRVIEHYTELIVAERLLEIYKILDS